MLSKSYIACSKINFILKNSFNALNNHFIFCDIFLDNFAWNLRPIQVLIVSVIYFSPESQYNRSLFNKVISELCHGFGEQEKCPSSHVVLKGTLMVVSYFFGKLVI